MKKEKKKEKTNENKKEKKKGKEKRRKRELTAVCRFSDPCLRLMTHSANS